MLHIHGTSRYTANPFEHSEWPKRKSPDQMAGAFQKFNLVKN